MNDTVLKPLSAYGTEIERTGDSLHQLGDQLRRVGVAPVAGLLDEGASYARRCGEYLRTADVATLLRDLDGLARRQPALVTAAALVVGVAGARMLKLNGRMP